MPKLNRFVGQMVACRGAAALAAIAGAAFPAMIASGQSVNYGMTIAPASSGLSATTEFEVRTAGTLRGDWDPVENPEGTRTALGFQLFPPLPFGPTQNDDIPLTLR